MEPWRRCGPCKKAINFNSLYYKCSASACHKQVFCSRDCWHAHLSLVRHKEAWPEEAYAPSLEEAPQGATGASSLLAKQAREQSPQASDSQEDLPQEVLIVASKLKQYIKAKGQMNTSAAVLDKLSAMVRRLCDQAIANAQKDGRKTVLDRDF